MPCPHALSLSQVLHVQEELPANALHCQAGRRPCVATAAARDGGARRIGASTGRWKRRASRLLCALFLRLLKRERLSCFLSWSVIGQRCHQCSGLVYVLVCKSKSKRSAPLGYCDLRVSAPETCISLPPPGQYIECGRELSWTGAPFLIWHRGTKAPACLPVTGHDGGKLQG